METNLRLPGIYPYWVIDPRLVYATILGVTREGVGHDEVSTTPVGRQFRHVPSEGKVEFDLNIPFVVTYERVLSAQHPYLFIRWESIQILIK